MNAPNYQKHSIPFYISPRLFRNKRLQQRRCKWAARLKKIQLNPYAHVASTPTVKTDRYRRQPQQQNYSNRHRWKSLQADVTIDLLSDESDNDEENGANPTTTAPTTAPTTKTAQATSTIANRNMQSTTTTLPSGNIFVNPGGSFQLSMVPNITLVPVQALQLQSKQNTPTQLTTAVDAARNAASESGKHKRKSHRPRKRTSNTNNRVSPAIPNTNSNNADDDCIVLTDDDDDDDVDNVSFVAKSSNKSRRDKVIRTLPLLLPRQSTSPPPLAPLSKCNLATETVEEVTVSLVPRSATTANCARQKQQQKKQAICAALRNSENQHMISNGDDIDAYGNENGTDEMFPMLPDETTVHTVIANRIYELSLSKLREGLASSGMPEFANETSPTQKLSPTQRQRKIATHAVTPPPAPISLKLSSDLSISLISDDEGEAGIGPVGYGERSFAGGASASTTAADEAHAAVKLLQQQHPQLSVVQHLQYHPDMVAVALAAAASRANAAHGPPVVSTATPGPRRRKLG